VHIPELGVSGAKFRYGVGWKKHTFIAPNYYPEDLITSATAVKQFI
jgi:hypothetical protein